MCALFVARNSLNNQVLDYLQRRNPSQSLIAAPDSVRDPYMGQGSHPDIVERVWKKIGSNLPDDCRCLIYGTPSLVQPASGVILAFCLGMQYCLRLAPGYFEEALKRGAKTSTKWSNGTVLDSTLAFGADWIFGAWRDEPEWCRKTYDAYNEPDGDSVA
jgi:hypothetical protein